MESGPKTALWPAFGGELAARGVIGPERDRIWAYFADLLRFNRTQNLISRREPAARARLLVLEAVEIHRWLQMQSIPGGPWLDLGSGAGFPGIVLGCLDPELELVLLDRRGSRCDFLRREVRALGLEGVRVVEGDARAEHPDAPAGIFAMVTAKAVAPPMDAIDLGARFVRRGGRILLFRGGDWSPSPEGPWSVVARWAPAQPPLSRTGSGAILLSL